MSGDHGVLAQSLVEMKEAGRVLGPAILEEQLTVVTNLKLHRIFSAI